MNLIKFIGESSNEIHNKMKPPLHITQHKRFVPYGTHPNFCIAKTSFMQGTLGAMPMNILQ